MQIQKKDALIRIGKTNLGNNQYTKEEFVNIDKEQNTTGNFETLDYDDGPPVTTNNKSLIEGHNTREKLAKATGVATGTFHKMETVYNNLSFLLTFLIGQVLIVD